MDIFRHLHIFRQACLGEFGASQWERFELTFESAIKALGDTGEILFSLNVNQLCSEQFCLPPDASVSLVPSC